MTNYTKTTDFAAKDALPSGNSAKIVKGSEIDTEFNNIATASATKANANAAALTGTTTFETISDGTIAITAFVDEDNMASDSATLLPTQQSVKAYVDSQVTAQDLDVTDGSTSIDIDLDSESLGILGGTGIDSTASGTGVTLAIDSTVATLTGSQTLSNKTLSAPVVSGNLTTDGLLDGRDVAADGTKLDGIESGATADQTAAEIKTAYESNADTNAFTDADESKLDGIEASADVTDTANVTAAGALMDSELTSEASVKALNQGVATTDSPTFAGLTTTADVSFGDNDKAIFGAGSDLQIYSDGDSSYLKENSATGSLFVDGDNIRFRTSDGSKSYALFTNSGSARLYHDNSIKIETTSTGIDVTGEITADALTINSSGVQIGTVLQSTSTTSARLALMDANTTAASQVGIGATGNTLGLYAGGGLPKVVVSGTGIDVTGTVTADGLTSQGTLGNWSIDSQGAIQTFTRASTNYIRASNASGALRFDTGGSNARLNIASNGDISFYEDTGTTPKFFWDASAESLGLGTTSPNADGLHIFPTGDSTNPALQIGGTTTYRLGMYVSGETGHIENRNGDDGIAFSVKTAGEAMRIDGITGNVGIGTSSPNRNLHIIGAYTVENSAGSPTGALLFIPAADANRIYSRQSNSSTSSRDLAFVSGSSEAMRISGGNVGIGTDSPNRNLHVSGGAADVAFGITNSASGTSASDGFSITLENPTPDVSIRQRENAAMKFLTNNTQRLLIDSSGNLLVGTTTTNIATEGTVIYGTNNEGVMQLSSTAMTALYVNRSNNGELVQFRAANVPVGSIGTVTQGGATNLVLDSTSAVYFDTNIRPKTDNTYDVGSSSYRFDDIYATNGTIQTSDRNEKQDIAELSDAEQRVAVAAKGLLRKFRWISSVEENGDDARIHFGIVAQDLQAAFEAEGLDAGRYAMFINTTWTDEETGEERSRMGVRYSELLAFIISAI